MDIIYRFDPHAALRRPHYPDPAAAIAALREGNERFAYDMLIQGPILGFTFRF